MAGLQLTKNNETFLIEPLGTVSQNNVAVGKWKTDQTNKIVVTRTTTLRFLSMSCGNSTRIISL
jgi:hypothetical protein